MDKRLILVFMVLITVLAGCSTDVQVTHSPIVVKKDDTVTFTAKAVTNTTPDSLRIQILVNAILVKTCTSSPCTYTGGPYPDRQDGFVSYAANIEAKYTFSGKEYTQSDVDGYYFTGVTDNSYNWNSKDYLYARYKGSTADHEDLVFHMADDYATNGQTFADFIDDVSDKVRDIYGGQDLIDTNLDKFNFWVYKKDAQATGCGTVHADADTDMPWREDDAVLHAANFQDCTSGPDLNHFSAEGSNTKAFLHESGHGVFGLADEYDGPTHYFMPAVEPNIFDTEAQCRTEQTTKGRDPDACYEFTTRSGGWWGIHQGTTVMTRGNVGDAWYTEAAEHVRWWFENF